jgi:hypothetical protein
MFSLLSGWKFPRTLSSIEIQHNKIGKSGKDSVYVFQTLMDKFEHLARQLDIECTGPVEIRVNVDDRFMNYNSNAEEFRRISGKYSYVGRQQFGKVQIRYEYF